MHCLMARNVNGRGRVGPVLEMIEVEGGWKYPGDFPLIIQGSGAYLVGVKVKESLGDLSVIGEPGGGMLYVSESREEVAAFYLGIDVGATLERAAHWSVMENVGVN